GGGVVETAGRGVQSFPAGWLCGFYRHILDLTSGAVSVAEYQDALHLCAYNVHNGHTGVGINCYVGDFADTWSGPFGTVVVNAGRWLGGCGGGGTPTPTPTASPTPPRAPCGGIVNGSTHTRGPAQNDILFL